MYIDLYFPTALLRQILLLENARNTATVNITKNVIKRTVIRYHDELSKNKEQ